MCLFAGIAWVVVGNFNHSASALRRPASLRPVKLDVAVDLAISGALVAWSGNLAECVDTVPERTYQRRLGA